MPEFLTTGCVYDTKLCTFAEPVGGPTTAWLQLRSRQTNCWIAAGIIEAAENAVFDTLLLIGPAGELFAYRKQFPAFFENLLFHRGRSAGIFDTALGRVGVMVCWDMVQSRVCRATISSSFVGIVQICTRLPWLWTGTSRPFASSLRNGSR